LLLGGTVCVASAHAELLRSSPSPDEQLAQAPSIVVLWFDEELNTHQSGFQILAGNGEAVDASAGRVDLTDPDHARLVAEGLPVLSEGVYTVQWTAVSMDDAFQAEGEFDFRVGNVAPRVKPQPAPTTFLAEPTPTTFVLSSSSDAAAPSAASPAWSPISVAAGLVIVVALISLLRADRR
jgi:methionine-rich copper-binding protein CopC